MYMNFCVHDILEPVSNEMQGAESPAWLHDHSSQGQGSTVRHKNTLAQTKADKYFT